MTRKEMIELLLLGVAITHQYFSDDEFMVMHNNVIYTEDGYTHGGLYDEFMEIRKGGFWEDGWKIYSGEINLEFNS